MELEIIQSRIYQVRGYRVMLDFHLAELYEVENRALKQAVRRNIDRFPPDFMFELSREEYNSLRSQIVTLKENGRGKYSKYNPYVFTEQGVAMLSSILRGKKAVAVNIAIMRAFVMLRQHLADYKDLKDDFKELREQIKELEGEMNIKFKDIHEALKYLLSPKAKRKPIGYKKGTENSSD